jgi:hypothetical protein
LLYKGLFHLHSHFSYDANLLLEELVQYIKREYNFAIFTEHTNALTKQQAQSFIKECKRLSGEQFLAIPAFEFPCEENNVHVIALGVEETPSINDFEDLLSWIRRKGGISIIAHPKRAVLPKAEFDGLEIWNLREDGGWAPSFSTLNACKRLWKGRLLFVGLDLHTMQELSSLFLEVQSKRLCKEDIISSIKRGNFWIRRGPLRIKATEPLSAGLLLIFYLIRCVYTLFKAFYRLFPIKRMYKKVRNL